MIKMEKFLGLLTHSELKILPCVLGNIKQREQVVSFRKNVSQSGVSTSVCNCLITKLEIAELIHTYSLGCKGTHIEVLDSRRLDELKYLIGVMKL